MVVVSGEIGKKCCFTGTEFQFWEVESILRTAGGDSSRIL